MTAIALVRIDLFIAGSVLAACFLLAAIGTSTTLPGLVRLLLETIWLYLSNARG